MHTAAAARSGPITIALTHHGADWIRGSEQCLLDLVGGLDRRRFTPVVFCDTPTLARESERLGAEAVLVADWGGGPLASAPVRRSVLAAMRARDVRLIHSNRSVTLPAVIPAARALRVPVVAHLHLPLGSLTDRLHSLVHQATVAVGVAHHVVRDLAADGMPETRVRVIYNATSDARLATGDARDLRDALGVSEDSLTVTSVGSLISRKGHDVVVRAVVRARSQGVPVHALICGEGEARAELEGLIATLGAGAYVHLLGMRADVGAILRDATDLYVTAAREEALPLNVLEAQWVGRAVIASDIAAHQEAVDASSALLIPGEDPAALADAIATLAREPEQRAAMAAAGQQFARATFSMERYVAEFERLYTQLLARPRFTNGWLAGSNWPPSYTRWMWRVVARRVLRR